MKFSCFKVDERTEAEEVFQGKIFDSFGNGDAALQIDKQMTLPSQSFPNWGIIGLSPAVVGENEGSN